MKRRTRFFWTAGGAGLAIGVIGLAAASAAANAPYSADDYDFSWLREGSSSARGVSLPDVVDPTTLDEGRIDPASIRSLGADGNAAFFVAVNGSGELCLISTLVVAGGTAEEWAAASTCGTPDSFNKSGLALRLTTPSDSVEGYLVPDEAAATVARNVDEESNPNLVVIAPNDPAETRAQTTEDLARAGLPVLGAEISDAS